jgi:hypothetical protein
VTLRLILANLFRARLRTALTLLGLTVAVIAFGMLRTVSMPGMPGPTWPRPIA